MVPPTRLLRDIQRPRPLAGERRDRDGIAVHGAGREGGKRSARRDALCQHAAGRIPQVDALGTDRRNLAEDPIARLFEGEHAPVPSTTRERGGHASRSPTIHDQV